MLRIVAIFILSQDMIHSFHDFFFYQTLVQIKFKETFFLR